ncbi:MAG: WGR domain-containing protein [Alphaproteobacteria bacterium]|nr:WGR domain-containing protein [Alphaproteobacteria bacterium]
MLNLFSLYLETSNVQAKHTRNYSIHLGKDLFGQWLVFTNFGPFGKKGLARKYAFEEIEEAHQRIQSILKKCFYKQNQISKHYQVKGFDIDSLNVPLPLSLVSMLPGIF